MVALRIACEACEVLHDISRMAKQGDFALPDSFDQMRKVLQQRAVKIVENLTFHRYAQSDASYFKAQCLLKVSKIFDDPISSYVFLNQGVLLLENTSYANDLVYETDKFCRAFNLDKNKEHLREIHEKRKKAVVQYALAQYQACLSSGKELDVIRALDYIQMATHFDPQMATSNKQAVHDLIVRVENLTSETVQKFRGTTTTGALNELGNPFKLLKQQMQEEHPYRPKMSRMQHLDHILNGLEAHNRALNSAKTN